MLISGFSDSGCAGSSGLNGRGGLDLFVLHSTEFLRPVGVGSVEWTSILCVVSLKECPEDVM